VSTNVTCSRERSLWLLRLRDDGPKKASRKIDPRLLLGREGVRRSSTISTKDAGRGEDVEERGVCVCVMMYSEVGSPY
jgi:hypothetical protein